MIQANPSEQLPMQQFTENAYLNYAMYVIMDRALPFIGDGLKPVQRRILYAMFELRLTAGAKFKKSARTVGDVLGKYHPHGDSACYEAMVLMAQPFSYRYPLIEGQGNWGTADDAKSFAAMRYTESRLSAFSNSLLSELTLETVATQPNFDATLQEPQWLPARLPHILLNGTTGIAVGMATDIPPHNLREIVQALALLIDDPSADLNAVMIHIQGPDYPTSAEIITSPADLAALYQSGRGSVKMRALWQQQGDTLIISALPYQVSGAKVLEQIAEQIRHKKLPMIDDLRDESNHENPVRLIIKLRAVSTDSEALMHHLFASTDLQKNYRVNLNILGLDGLPAVKNLTTLLKEWLDFRRTAVRRRLQYRLEKVRERLHLLAGLHIAFLNLEQIIAIIRHEEPIASALIKCFNLTARQAEAILELKLRQLAQLEGSKIDAEQRALEQERLKLEKLLGSESQLNQLIKQELLSDAKQYGDQRRSPLVARSEAKVLNTPALQSAEPVTIVLSQQGWIRCLKGHEHDPTCLNYRAGDSYQAHVRGNSHKPVLLFDSTGRSYTLDTPVLLSIRNQGEPLSTQLTLPPSASIEHLLMAETHNTLMLASDAGYGFICRYTDVLSRNRAGKALFNLSTQARLLPPLLLNNPQENDKLLAITTIGRLLIFPLNEVVQLSKGKGCKIIAFPGAAAQGEQLLIHLALLPATTHSVTLFAGKRKKVLKAVDLAPFYGARADKGALLPRGLQRVDKVMVDAG